MDGSLEKIIGSNHVDNWETYSYDEAVSASTQYFKGDSLAGGAWVNKYALKDSEGNIFEKTPEDMHVRIASEIARIENKYQNPMSEELVHSLLKDFKYIIPQGSPMAGIGNDFQRVSLSNCFVIGEQGPADSYGAITKIDQEQVQLMKRRGGVGHDLSGLRPHRSPVDNSALTSTGIVPFMERYSNSTREVAQDGRRGALMLSVSIKHPDSEQFIDAKMQEGKVTGANVSVRIDDEFMQAVRDGKMYTQQFPVDSDNPTFTQEVDPKVLWDKIVHNAWKSAEPGILFWDTITKESVPDEYADLGFKTTSTNPCGEIPLCPYDSCRLLAMNLYSYVENPFTDEAQFNYELFTEHVGYAQRMMDDIVDLESEKIDKILEKIENDPEDWTVKRVEYELWQKIKDKTERGRRTGLGITAEGDTLAALGYTYGTDEGNRFSEELHKTLATEAYRASVNMVKEGRPKFEIYDSSREENNPFINRIKEADQELYEEMVEHGRRNISILTIAPTGTTSLMAQTTSGLEPVFMPAYKRRKKVNANDENANITFIDEVGDAWEEYNVLHHKFADWAEINGYDPKKLKDMGADELQKIVAESPYHKATSNDVDWLKKVELQGAVQKWVDHSISVTINLPEDVPEKLVGQLYMKAWEEGCKGVTVYRDGSRSGVLISNTKKEDDKEQLSIDDILSDESLFKEALKKRIDRPRPEYVGGMKEKVQTPHGYNAFVSVNWEKGENGELIDPYEAFVEIGKAGDDLAAIAQGFGRVLSLALKAGIPYEMIEDQIVGIGGNSKVGFGPFQIKSLPDAIGKGMQKSIEKEKRLYDLIKKEKDESTYTENEKEQDKSDKDESNEITSKNSEKSKPLTKKVETNRVKDPSKTKASGNLCPNCGQSTVMQEGCEVCLNCGHSKC